MKRIVIGEHSRLFRGAVPAGSSPDSVASVDERVYDRLRRFDKVGRSEGEQVFDWRDGFARTKQWVGVVQIPGLQVEILPKVDVSELLGETEEAQYTARANLLYMLAVGGNIPVRSRDTARLATRRAPLSETLAAIFADRLRRELLRGPERGYHVREENLRCFKGKLLIAKQSQANAAHRERFFCRFDEFSEDTPMNRIFKTACRVLCAVTWTPATQDALWQCVLLLDGATDVEVQDSDFAAITINRQNQRFEDVLRFCRLILGDRTPTVAAGRTRSFSLLFDMNRVFERFVAALLCRKVAPRIGNIRVYPQAASRRRHLLEWEGAGVLRLQPDIFIEHGERRLVMDTKWKVLAPGKRGRGGVADGDLYQLYAYTRRFGSLRSVLLYPHVPGLGARDFSVLDSTDAHSGEHIAVRQVRLHRNLYVEAEREKLVSELELIVREGLGLSGGTPSYGDAA